MSKAFLDSNILIYCYAAGDPRIGKAQQLVRDGGVISIQCLNEFATVARRKLNMPWPDVHEALNIVRALCNSIVALDEDVHLLGLRIAEDRQLSIYDGMIVAAALRSGSTILYSEDLHHGLVIEGGLTIMNPFRS